MYKACMEVEYHLPYKLIIIIGICLSFFCGIANIRQDSVHLLILVVLYDCHPDYHQRVWFPYDNVGVGDVYDIWQRACCSLRV